MFNTLKGFLFGFIAGCIALTGLAFTHHIVRTTGGTKVVRKETFTFEKIYVDARAWGAVDLVQNRDVVQALARAGYEQSRDAAERSLKNGRDALERSVQDALKPR